MASLRHGVLTVKISSFSHNLTGFYFTPIDGETKCLLLDPSIDKCDRITPLAEILSSGVFSEISYRELINPNDAKRFKLSLVNMQSSFDTKDLEIAIRDEISSSSCSRESVTNTCGWDNYAQAHISYVAKAVGQNPAERVKQCSGECYIGSVPDIKSYDPFGPVKIYPRTVSLVSDSNRLKRWEEFFNTSHMELVSSSVTFSQHPDALFQNFLNLMIDNGTAANDVIPMKLPLSFRVPANYVFSDNTEKMVTTWGLNIYDGACWEIALWLLKDSNASLLDQVRLSRKTTQFASIISNNVNSKQAHRYLSPVTIEANTYPSGAIDPNLRKITYPYDPNGFTFRWISNYYSYSPTTIRPQQWGSTAKYWSDFRPTTSENAWFYAIAPFIRNIHISNFKGYSGFITALSHMMDANGGFYHSPINSSWQGKSLPNESWSLTSEGNVSMYGALNRIKAYWDTQREKGEVSDSSKSSGKIEEPHGKTLRTPEDPISSGKIITMMAGIEQYFASVADHKNYFFYHGKTWLNSSWQLAMNGLRVESSGVVPFSLTTDNFNMPLASGQVYMISVNVQTWAICSLQPSIIDKIFGVRGATLKMWNNLKQTCGRKNSEGELIGFGYNNLKHEDSVISSELTFSAMMACKVLQAYYGSEANTYSIDSDLDEMEDFILTPNSGGINDHHLLFVSDISAYYNQTNIRAQTGFGSYVNPIPSIAATAWYLFYIKEFNPFTPKGLLLR